MRDDDAQAYIDGIDPANRPLFDRIDRLILEDHPTAHVVISYKMPTYLVGERRLHVATWKHGVSLYGWDADRDGGFVARHPELSSGKGTIRLPTETAGDISDDELRAVLRGALSD